MRAAASAGGDERRIFWAVARAASPRARSWALVSTVQAHSASGYELPGDTFAALARVAARCSVRCSAIARSSSALERAVS